jgi:hypothetical protein
MMQKLTIKFETDRETIESSYESLDIGGDLFWEWFFPVWNTLGLPFVANELKLEEQPNDK